MRRTTLVLALCLALIPTQSMAATKEPTPTPKATPKATVKATPAPTPKATATKKATPTKKPAVKKKRNPVKPSPSPKWPPAGFKVMDDIYYRTPSVEVMMNVAADTTPTAKALAKAIAACKEFSCGRLQVASLIGCVYWEIDSKVITPNPDLANSFLTLGMLRTLVKKSAPKEVVTLVLPSGELLSGTIAVVPVGITCHQDQTTEVVPSNTYLRR
jgi:hypothetical protein